MNQIAELLPILMLLLIPGVVWVAVDCLMARPRPDATRPYLDLYEPPPS